MFISEVANVIFRIPTSFFSIICILRKFSLYWFFHACVPIDRLKLITLSRFYWNMLKIGTVANSIGSVPFGKQYQIVERNSEEIFESLSIRWSWMRGGHSPEQQWISWIWTQDSPVRIPLIWRSSCEVDGQGEAEAILCLIPKKPVLASTSAAETVPRDECIINIPATGSILGCSARIGELGCPKPSVQ